MISVIGVLGIILVLSGSAGFFYFDDGLKMGLREFINLAEDGPIFPQFIQPPIKPVTALYLFAIKNPTQVLEGKKASFALKGPYLFETIVVRDNIKFSKDKERLNYVWGRKLVWKEESSSDPNEKMWTLNPTLPGIVSSLGALLRTRIPFRSISEPLAFRSINTLIDFYQERLIHQKTPKQLLDGNKIGIMDDLVGLGKRLGLQSFLPPTPPDNMFGIVYVQNRTFYETEVWTGLGKTKSRYAEVSKYMGRSRLEFWQGKCNAITGTNGELFKPFLKPGKRIRVFMAPFCRSFDLDPVGSEPVQTKSGVMALEYEFGRGLFQGVRSNPDNKCFCARTRSFDCQYDGLVSLGPCFYESPLFLTRPNFRDVDSKISNLVDLRSASVLNGTANPNWQAPSKQIFRIEPITGSVLEVDVSMMGTFKVTRQPNLRDMAKIQRLAYMPLFMNHDAVSLSYELIWPLYYLQKFHKYHQPIMAGVAGVGLGAIALKILFGVV